MSQANLRVYVGSCLGCGPRRPPRTTDVEETAAHSAAPPSFDETIDREIIRILDGAANGGESVQGVFTRKENELRELIASLSQDEAAALQTRLGSDTASVLKASFARLTAERRGRITAFLSRATRSRSVKL